MAKYKQDRKDRRDESYGMKRSAGFVEGHDESIGRNDHAGLPQKLEMREYPKSEYGRSGYIDDSMTDIDDCMEDSKMKRERNLSNQK